MAAKSDSVVKLALVFVVSFLSFAVGTFVGTKYSDQKHKQAAFEPSKKDSQGHDDQHTAADDGHGQKAQQMSDEEIAKLAEEFVSDDEPQPEPVGHGEAMAAQNAPQAGGEHREPAAVKKETPAAAHEAPTPAKHEAAEKRPLHAEPPGAPKNLAAYPTAKFTVQVAAFSNEGDAQKKAGDLKKKGYSAFYTSALVNGQTWYRVSVGQFPSEQEAKSYRSEFMAKTKIESTIIQKMAH